MRVSVPLYSSHRQVVNPYYQLQLSDAHIQEDLAQIVSSIPRAKTRPLPRRDPAEHDESAAHQRADGPIDNTAPTAQPRRTPQAHAAHLASQSGSVQAQLASIQQTLLDRQQAAAQLQASAGFPLNPQSAVALLQHAQATGQPLPPGFAQVLGSALGLPGWPCRTTAGGQPAPADALAMQQALAASEMQRLAPNVSMPQPGGAAQPQLLPTMQVPGNASAQWPGHVVPGR